MALKIRLRRQGCTNNIVHRIVVTDGRAPRDGKYIESIGWYKPKAREGQERYLMHPDRLQHWLGCGAQMSDTVATIAQQAAPGVSEQYRKQMEARKVKRAKAR